MATDHLTIAHRWAQRNSALSLRGFNVFADGLSIYSYGRHFEIARWTETRPKKADAGDVPQYVVLFNDENRSVSTSKHQSYVRRAIPAGTWVFNAPSGLWHDGKAMLAHFEEKAGELYNKGLRARVHAGSYYRQARAALDMAERYAKAFGLKYTRPLNLDVLGRKLAERAVKLAKAEAKARREREKREAEERKRQQVRDAFQFEAWQAGQPVACPRSYWAREDGTAYVTRTHYEDGTSELRTSQGAAVPWEHAVKAFRFIRLCVERGEGWQRNGRTVRVGHYQLDRIEPNGDMTAGCHRFAWAEMRALAEREGVLALEPSAEAVETRP